MGFRFCPTFAYEVSSWQCPVVCVSVPRSERAPGPTFLLEAPQVTKVIIVMWAHLFSLRGRRCVKGPTCLVSSNPQNKPTKSRLLSSLSYGGGNWGTAHQSGGLSIDFGFIAGTSDVDVTLPLYHWVFFYSEKWNPRKWTQGLLLESLLSLHEQSWEGSFFPASVSAVQGLAWGWGLREARALDDPAKP